MKSNKALIVIFLFLSFLVIFLVSAIRNGGISYTPAKKVTTDFVKKRTIEQFITGSGKVRPHYDIKITSEISGEVTAVYVKEGDTVKKDELLLRLKPDAFQAIREKAAADLSVAKAALAQAKAKLEQVKAQATDSKTRFKRVEVLYGKEVVSRAEFDLAQRDNRVAAANVKSAEADVQAVFFNVKEAEALLKESDRNLNKSGIYAPSDGVVSMVNVKAGERVLGTSFMEGTPLLRIFSQGQMEVHFTVSESEVIKLALNDSADIELSPYPGKIFKGLITAVSSAPLPGGANEVGTTDFEVRAAFLPSAYKSMADNTSSFKDGMSAEVMVKTYCVKNALTVPKEAITKKDNKPAVFLYNKGLARLVTVAAGAENNEFIAVTGITEKQEVITGPDIVISMMLKDGDKVEKINNVNDRKIISVFR